MLIHNKDDIQFVTEFPCFWDTLYNDHSIEFTKKMIGKSPLIERRNKISED